MSALKSMLPTDCFSIGNSRSPTGSTFTEARCESERLTLGGALAARSGPLGAPCALASDRWAPSREIDPSFNCAKTQAKAATANPAAAMPTVLLVFPDVIAKTFAHALAARANIGQDDGRRPHPGLL